MEESTQDSCVILMDHPVYHNRYPSEQSNSLLHGQNFLQLSQPSVVRIRGQSIAEAEVACGKLLGNKILYESNGAEGEYELTVYADGRPSFKNEPPAS